MSYTQDFRKTNKNYDTKQVNHPPHAFLTNYDECYGLNNFKKGKLS